jgi:predicted nucleic acid-binding protein
MPYLLDTNILLRLAEPAHPMHAAALQAVEAILEHGEEVFLVPQNLMEFWVVATRPRERNGLGMTAAEATPELARIEAQFALLPDPPLLYAEWRRLVTAHAIVGVRGHDVRLVAAMLIHGLTHLLTFNVDDFRQFQGIVVVHPGEPAG